MRSASGGEPRQLPVDELGQAIGNGRLAIWIDLLRPQDQASGLLRDCLGLGPLTIEDCLSPLRMPKIDIFADGGAFVAAFAIRLDEGEEPRLRASEVDLVVGGNYLATVRDDPVREVAERIQAELCRSEPAPGDTGAALAHAALDALIDRQMPVLVRAAEVAERLEDRLDLRAERSSVALLERLIVLRRDLLAFRRLAVAQQQALRQLERAIPQLGAYLSDAADNQREAVNMADATRDYIDGAIEAYRMRRDERVEGGIRRLAVLAGILGPLTLVVGMFGSNFRNIPGVEYPWGFWVLTAVEIALAVAAFAYLRWRGVV